jgi:DNA-binding TFAR19-related protein (PDSD5 family)
MDPNIVQPDSDENKAKQEQEEQMRRDLLATVLDTAARERCAFLQFMDIT